ncbi:Myblike DNAbinding domain-containing protein [Clydaea vesicula]|uniref:Myblike DNAbinding domain-containing protein n=1 Tax=Clydaea vesicula TaxID=447962 RepID=A0AAD5U7U7_9FUNG|nr:Myblike DNAbinding domain-containing protein [Clydaea vesicula]
MFATSWELKEKRNLTNAVQDWISFFNYESNNSSASKKIPLDWEVISYNVKGRSPIECRIEWENNLDPNINTADFTQTEKVKLNHLIDLHVEGDEPVNNRWFSVAEKLGNGKLPWQCFKYYKSEYNNNLNHEIWSAEEVALLKDLFSKYGKKWTKISNELKIRGFTREAGQCLHKFKHVSSDRKLGRWKKSEDDLLIKAVKKFGRGKWNLIQCEVPQRSDVQCRERYENVLCPDLYQGNLKDLSQQDIQKLVSIVNEIGTSSFTEVARRMDNKMNDAQCKRAWNLHNPTKKK